MMSMTLDHDCVLAGCPKALPGICPDGLEHTIGRDRRVPDENDQRFLNQLRKKRFGIRLADWGKTRDLGCCYDRKRVVDRRQPSKQRTLQSRQQFVAPIEGSLERLMSGGGCPLAIAEEAEAVVQSRFDSSDSERRDTVRCQLDRESDAVEASADASDHRSQRIGQDELRGGCGSAVDEQLDGGEGERILRKDVRVLRRIDQAVESEDDFSVCPQRFATGHDYLHMRSLAEDRLRERGGHVGHLLAIVEYEQHPQVGQPTEYVGRRALSGTFRSEGSSDGCWHQSLFLHEREVHEADLRLRFEEPGRGRNRDRGLADASEPGDRGEAIPAKQVDDLENLALATDHGLEQRR